MPATRAAAARCLAQVAQGQSLSKALPAAEARIAFDDRSLLRELCYGSLRHYYELLGIAEQCLSKKLKAKDHDVLMLILLGLYQLEYMRVPAHAAINTTVAATDNLKKSWAKGLTNAVLRRYQRERDTLRTALSPAAACAHPLWLYEAIHQHWPDQADAILDANNQHPPLCLRVNRLLGSREAYLSLLTGAGIEASPCELASQGVRLHQPVPVSALPGFEDGRVTVQDEAAQLCAELLAPAPGARVLDACAAPGGKSSHLLECQPDIELIVLDIDPARLERVEENLARLSLQASVIAGDAGEPDGWWDGQAFDAILLDAPCSASGVIRRNPDIKLLREEDDIPALAQLQLHILQAQWSLLKRGGRLLYATCSIFPEENTRVIETFLSGQSDASEIALPEQYGLAQACGRQLFPVNNSHDGFYFALLEKS